VIGDSLRHKLRKGDKERMKPGSGLTIDNESFETIEHAVLYKVILTQNNDEAELKENDDLFHIKSRESFKSSQPVEKDQGGECGRS
jgi:hypothetical protein